MFHFLKVEHLQSCLLFKGMDVSEKRKFLICALRELTSSEVGPVAAKEISSLKNKSCLDLSNFNYLQ